MGDSRRLDTGSGYFYVQQHTSALHPHPQPTFDRGSSLAPVPASLCSLQGTRPPQLLSPPLSHQQPTHLQLNPYFQLGRSNKLSQKLSLPHSFPTGTVSSYSHNPASERDYTRTAVKNNSVKSNKARQQQLDGNNIASHSVNSGATPMTSNGFTSMGGKRDEGVVYFQSQRPPLVSQHSNSVPSTPHQYPREFASRSRSPSPNGGLGSHSPRSVVSEANGTMPSLRKAHGSCKYETNVAFGRRRIPYVSSEILQKAKDEPKKVLDPHEDEKLSGDMRELYDRLLPSEESMHRREAFVAKLEHILHTEWPGNEFKVHVFGSSGNLLYTNDSDVDVCIQTPMHKLEEMHMLAEALAKHGMEKVVCVPGAKVRIVKIWDPELELACDMNVNNTLALDNTRMIKTYVQIDERVRPLAMIIKYWTKRRILNDAALGGTISSYTWICMILNFLQTRQPPILPSLHKLPYRTIVKETGQLSSFADDLEKLNGFGDENKESIGQLLFQFFRRYGHEIDFEKSVISVREGRLMDRAEKHWDVRSLTKEGRNRLCVEEPFNTERNLGNSADDYAWHGIHLEIRRAFDLLADGGQLDKACEQFEFPPEEKTVFKKPTPSVKPILTSSLPMRSVSGRGGSSNRGNRGGFNPKGNNNAYGRRASSAASFGNNRPPFLHSPPISAGTGQEYLVRGLNEQLHDQLFQQYQLLEIQSNSLRAQLAAQQRAQQAHHVQQAQMHAHVVAQAQAQAQAQAHNRGQPTNGSPQKSPFINGQASPRLPEMVPNSIPQGFLYHYPGFYDTSSGMGASQDVPKTNPSSPSLTNSVPGLRRTVHRTSNASDTTGSLRSHSQPARPVPPPAVVPGYPRFQYVDPSTFAGYPIARSSQEVPAVAYTETVADHGTPKEYVGYYVEESPQIRPQARSPLQEYSVPQIPSYSELAQRRRRVSPEMTQPLLNTALRRVSRSPSPLGEHVRSYSTGEPQASQDADRSDNSHRPEDNFLVIANGSYPTQARESRTRSETVDTVSSAASVEHADPSALGIYLNNGEYRIVNPVQNGVLSSPSPGESHNLSRIPSGGKQPFPQLPESWMNYDVVNGDKQIHSVEVSPTNTQQKLQQQWRAAPFPNGLSTLDTSNAPRPPPQEIKSAGLPLLSPVIETRTPSPTASRQSELSKQQQLNGIKGHAKENHTHGPHRHGAAHASSQTHGVKDSSRQDKAVKGSSGASQSQSNWQQTTQKKRNKKAKSNGQKHGHESKTLGQPLPVNEADRKGG
ncbi:hypothetical protein GQ43DRAFT_21034 [Delitschia confertaspora ATCC 74209]|uniref:polynucleotide adenylyltransferase n=1 Tax=Delitschia confertaspora ATCC 74209 TaxID=1513339 RepID=A0A9P4JMI1_9PLEO|nr:hypothetical protein GQ43DRAFT_21034 [Delitschia confertaspora ATCC 74209]